MSNNQFASENKPTLEEWCKICKTVHGPPPCTYFRTLRTVKTIALILILLESFIAPNMRLWSGSVPVVKAETNHAIALTVKSCRKSDGSTDTRWQVSSWSNHVEGENPDIRLRIQKGYTDTVGDYEEIAKISFGPDYFVKIVPVDVPPDVVWFNAQAEALSEWGDGFQGGQTETVEVKEIQPCSEPPTAESPGDEPEVKPIYLPMTMR